MNQLKRSCAWVLSILLLLPAALHAQTPLSMNGQLKLVGNQLSNACGDPVQLRGMSTHTPMGHSECYTEDMVATLANDWGSDILRLAMYTDVNSGTDYIDNPTTWDNWIDQMVDLTEEYGMYCMIDWHILEDGDPMTHVAEAETFFDKMSELYVDRDHVIYEICNEPNGWPDWNRVRQYAEIIIPIIRANDPDAIIIVGNPQWSSRPGDVWQNPLSSQNQHNVMYSYHFYAGSHYDYDYLKNVLGSLPIFVTEWGTTSASGNWGYNEQGSNTWLDILDGNNQGGQLVSSCNWSYSDKDESSAALNSGACALGNWNDRSQSGNYAYGYISETDNFTQCSFLADDDNDGVLNKDDICPNTPANDNVDAQGCTAPLSDVDGDGVEDSDDECPGTTPGALVNIYGCEILNDFVNNSCYGVNNYQGYVRDDFESDSGYYNISWWAKDGESGVSTYAAEETGGELVVEVLNADPDWTTFGVSWWEDASGNLVAIDISHHPVVEFDMIIDKTGSYSESTINLDIVLEDIEGNQINADALQNVMRKSIPLGTQTHVTADFDGGLRESWDDQECPGGTTPCYFDVFDFTHVAKVMMWVNAGAGESWSKPIFSGTWTMDNFSLGYNDNTVPCTEIRDDDGDGVAIENEWCHGTPANESVDEHGCGASQLDDDQDGVSNLIDACPATEAEADVNESGCSVDQQDDDLDGVPNADDLCPDTPLEDQADADGCGEGQVITHVNELVEKGFSIYPVPAQDYVSISHTGGFNQAMILDLQGRIVAQLQLDGLVTTVTTSNFEAGVYVVELTGDNATERSKVVIE